MLLKSQKFSMDTKSIQSDHSFIFAIAIPPLRPFPAPSPRPFPSSLPHTTATSSGLSLSPNPLTCQRSNIESRVVPKMSIDINTIILAGIATRARPLRVRSPHNSRVRYVYRRRCRCCMCVEATYNEAKRQECKSGFLELVINMLATILGSFVTVCTLSLSTAYVLPPALSNQYIRSAKSPRGHLSL
ncbi:hypothetical protein T492DRAFT_1029725 [Pavlovales sp. CCMP2436]|nr:hypothetical protein T492DRAFT_1029725 [Pavlovales sp. CCMP2436]